NVNDVKANGFYRGGENPGMDVTARINRFDLTSLQPILSNQLEDLAGVLTGQVIARGTPEKPDIDGQLRFNETKFLSTYLNTRFSIASETISFIEEGISFDAFEVADQNDNKARLDGTIQTAD